MRPTRAALGCLLLFALAGCRLRRHHHGYDAGVVTAPTAVTLADPDAGAVAATVEPSLSADPTAMKGFSLHKSGCDGGDSDSCVSLGLDYERGTGVAKDMQKAVALYERACAAKNTTGCYDRALIAFHAKDYAIAMTDFTMACKGEDMDACAMLGRMYRDAQGVAKDEAAGAGFFKRSCDKGNGYGCNSLGLMFEEGRGVHKDETRAFAVYRTACNSGNQMGCYNVARCQEYGKGTSIDVAAARKLYKSACDAREGLACAGLGVLYEKGKGVMMDQTQANDLYERACNLESATGCRYLAMSYEHGMGVAKDENHALALYKQACDGDDSDACTDYGTLKRKMSGQP